MSTNPPPELPPDRPFFRYLGGKWKLAPWIIRHMPPHRIYTEVFGGGASVLLAKPRAYGEIYNDLNGELVNLFRMARDRGAELVRAVELTPYARAEFDAAYDVCCDDLERARRALIRGHMGMGAGGLTRPDNCGFKGAQTAGAAYAWHNLPDSLRLIVQRLRSVAIEQRDALRVLTDHDCPDALHYVDPPYVHETRTIKQSNAAYAFELSDEQHRELAKTLHSLQGCVMLSGYTCPLYDELYSDWRRVDIATKTDSMGNDDARAKARIESVWLSSACPQVDLFDDTEEI